MAQQELVQAHRTAFNAQNAFLLGISASAIAFTFHSTSDAALTLSTKLMLGGAAVWAISFAAGVRKSQKNMEGISYNLGLLEARRLGLADKVDEASKKFSGAQNSSGRLHTVQLWSLLIGAILFALGHVVQMNANVPTPSDAPSLTVPDQQAVEQLPAE